MLSAFDKDAFIVLRFRFGFWEAGRFSLFLADGVGKAPSNCNNCFFFRNFVTIDDKMAVDDDGCHLITRKKPLRKNLMFNTLKM